ncbi:hypothetical protein BBM40_21475 [Vibrio parahaemolyticus]|jgi:hypothetical protein|uniref:Uncharacterized protein n=2 Tax=Vibrio harveyi group TaxID=717610 RepID=A0AAP9GB56_9VIBR|nr:MULTISPECIES: hypothetical protein [Vibrionaceae]EHZ2903829.1 hypothetical protein [Vibrio vulnificus]KGY10797.1 hypothetical protein NM22_18915 [Vibrio tubiashii]AYO19649.1 hypothetical protein D0856_05680 [Vibrio owensii]EIA1338754.1 hypothetical protein [Vibrio vulnificus]EIX4871647.1 hypothetical protein [Vibrio vulnificus]
MSCDSCKQIKLKIGSPDDLVTAILLVRRSVEAKSLKYLGYGAFGEPFSRFSNGKCWGDIVNNYFACKSCGQLIHLRAETYHGSGGQLAQIAALTEKVCIDGFTT